MDLDPKELKSKNALLLHFHSAKLIAKKLEEKYGRVRAGSWNLGDPSRVYVRKAQYDWRLVGYLRCKIWTDVYLIDFIRWDWVGGFFDRYCQAIYFVVGPRTYDGWTLAADLPSAIQPPYG